MIYTYQDYIKARDTGGLAAFVGKVIDWHRGESLYQTALIADEYDREQNVTILNFIKWVMTGSGECIPDDTVTNNKITSNYFARLNTQRCLYSLGNGMSFANDGENKKISRKLGLDFDKVSKDAAYYSLIHGVSFVYLRRNEDSKEGYHTHLFKVTEFAPLWDERTSALGAGVRFWQIDSEHPMYAILYAPEGYMEFVSQDGVTSGFKAVSDKFIPYRTKVQKATATTLEVVTDHNYPYLPIVPWYGSRLQQSTLIGMRSKIDSYDIIFSGFANDLQDCAQIYWIINGAAGMTDKDIKDFRDRLRNKHMAAVKSTDETAITPYTQEVPYNAREVLLKSLRAQIYEDFGGLDVHTVAAGATNDHIAAAYQPLDEQADDFEYQIIEAVRLLLGLLGIDPEDATPQFKRTRVINQMELAQMIAMFADRLTDDAILDLLPFITPEIKKSVIEGKTAEELGRIADLEDEPPEGVTDDGET